jgi:hypothetical protein
MNQADFRAAVLRSFGANPEAVAELLAYNANPFRHDTPALCEADEPFMTAWRGYASDAAEEGTFAALQPRLIQLQFPVRAGISQTEAYRQATLRGVWPPEPYDGGLRLEAPERLRLVLHPTPAGTLPLLIAEHRPDFVALVQALLRQNEPAPIPASMGASMVAGYNNWDRIRTHRERWAHQAVDASEAAWGAEFQQLMPRKEAYQDRFILLSDGPYSAVPAPTLGLDDATWRQCSLIIRREHECAHYYTRRILGAMRNNMLDELIADYMGIAAARGHYRADWFLHFVGLEDFPHYREGGRLQNYRGTPPLSNGAFALLQQLVHQAAHHLEQFGPTVTEAPESRALALQTLTRLTLEEMASDEADARLRAAQQAAEATLLQPA